MHLKLNFVFIIVLTFKSALFAPSSSKLDTECQLAIKEFFPQESMQQFVNNRSVI